MSLLEPDWVARHGLNPLTVMAVLPPGADLDDVAPDDVRENGLFLGLLSRTIYENADRCDQLRQEASIQHDGYVFLVDGRARGPGGEVPPEDVIGDFEARGGVLVANSYRHNPRHRLLTSTGWFQLPPEIETVLRERLRAPAPRGQKPHRSGKPTTRARRWFPWG